MEFCGLSGLVWVEFGRVGRREKPKGSTAHSSLRGDQRAELCAPSICMQGAHVSTETGCTALVLGDGNWTALNMPHPPKPQPNSHQTRPTFAHAVNRGTGISDL